MMIITGRRKRTRQREELDDDEDRRAEIAEQERIQNEKLAEEQRKIQEEEERRIKEEQNRKREEEANKRAAISFDMFSAYNDMDSSSSSNNHFERDKLSPYTSSAASSSSSGGGLSPSFSLSVDQRVNKAIKLGFGLTSSTTTTTTTTTTSTTTTSPSRAMRLDNSIAGEGSMEMMKPSMRKRPLIAPGFNLDEEPNPLLVPKKKKLVPLDPIKSEEQIKKEREEEAKNIVKFIPAGKEELFSYAMNWDIIDSVMSPRSPPSKP